MRMDVLVCACGTVNGCAAYCCAIALCYGDALVRWLALCVIVDGYVLLLFLFFGLGIA